MPLVYDDSIDNVQNQPGTVLAVTASSTSSVYVTGSVTVSQSNIPAGTVTITASLASPVWVNTTGTITVNTGTFPVITVNSHAVTQGGGWNAIVSGVVGVTGVWASPVVVTGAVGSPIWVATTGGFGGGVQYGTGSVTPYTGTIALAVSGAAAVALSSSNVSGALWVQIPASQMVSAKLTGNSSTNADGEAVATSGYAEALSYGKMFNGTTWDRIRGTAAGGLTVSQSNTPAGVQTVTSTFATPVWVNTTGTITVNTGTFPTVTVAAHAVTQGGGLGAQVSGVVGVVQSGAFTVQVSGTAGGPVWVTGAVGSPVFVGQTASWLVGTGTFPSNITVNTGTFPVVTVNAHAVTQGGGWGSQVSGVVGVVQSGGFTVQVSSTWGAILPVTSAVGSPVWVTLTGAIPGTTTVSQSNTPAGTQMVGISGSYTGSVTSQLPSTTGVQLIAANTTRVGVSIYNASAQSWYVRLGGTASLTNFTLVVATSGYYETPWAYNGPIWGLQATAGAGNIYVTEVV